MGVQSRGLACSVEGLWKKSWRAPEHRRGPFRACLWKNGPSEDTARGLEALTDSSCSLPWQDQGQGVQGQEAVRTARALAGQGIESARSTEWGASREAGLGAQTPPKSQQD